MAIRCFWPPDSCVPFSPKRVSYPYTAREKINFAPRTSQTPLRFAQPAKTPPAQHVYYPARVSHVATQSWCYIRVCTAAAFVVWAALTFGMRAGNQLISSRPYKPPGTRAGSWRDGRMRIMLYAHVGALLSCLFALAAARAGAYLQSEMQTPAKTSILSLLVMRGADLSLCR
jgi:hypothetical protein